MRAGALQLTAGSRLTAVELGAAVAAGVGTLSVSRRPRVTILCTGDELRAPGEPLGPGEIHNSNAPMLVGLATGAGALAAPARRLPDDRGATERGIEEALQSSDVVIISGGVSVGPHDHVKPALAELGVEEVFWCVALQPGKPTWFGLLRSGPDQPLVFGLPGNPSRRSSRSRCSSPPRWRPCRVVPRRARPMRRPPWPPTSGAIRAATRRSASASSSAARTPARPP